MAKVGAQRAAELTGRSKSTIQRAMNNGKLSYEVDPNGRRIVDVSELDRAFGLLQEDGSTGNASVEQELEKASSMLEMERLKMRIRMLEEQFEMAQDQIADLKDQRDLWQKQASQVLITSQFSQKQAEDLKAELKERERRAKERRDMMEKQMQEKQAQQAQQKMQKLKPAGNENDQKPEAEDAADDNSRFKGLWKRVKQAAS
ncbi:MAG: entry exclusion 1 domain-containing protein [Alphaproteobacteria bacterium]